MYVFFYEFSSLKNVGVQMWETDSNTLPVKRGKGEPAEDDNFSLRLISRGASTASLLMV